MSHSHESHHHNENNKLGVVLGLTALFMVLEFVGGFLTNSLALTADAGHMLSDVGALSLSYFAIWISSKPATSEKTYGYFRTEILAAFINGIALVGIALFIIYEAYLRLWTQPEVKAPTMLVIAFAGLVVNIIGAYLLHKGSKENLNIRGAFLHVIGDLLGSVGAIIAGLLILFGNFYIADPIISIVIAFLVLYSSITLINEAVQVLLEAAPSHISVESIREHLLKIPDVIDVHDLHVWSIASHQVALSVHIVTPKTEGHEILCEAVNLLDEKFGIHHTTIQIEPEDFHINGCPLHFH